MAVPKKRTGHSAQGHRRSNWKATKPETTTCTKCGALVLTHTICTACGYYKGKAVSIKSADYVETAIDSKKPAKKAAAKTKTQKAEIAVEEVKVDEVVETVVAEKEAKPKKTETKTKAEATPKKTAKPKSETKTKKTKSEE